MRIRKLLVCEANEVWNYAGCAAQEENPRVRAIWEQFLDYELGQFQVALKLFKDIERRDPAEVLGDGKLPKFIEFRSHRDFVRKVVEEESGMRKDGTQFVDTDEEGETSIDFRDALNADGSPSRAVSETWSWSPGTELTREAA